MKPVPFLLVKVSLEIVVLRESVGNQQDVVAVHPTGCGCRSSNRMWLPFIQQDVVAVHNHVG
jgi:hypothetical protein